MIGTNATYVCPQNTMELILRSGMSENFILKSLTFEKYFKATAKIGKKGHDCKKTENDRYQDLKSFNNFLRNTTQLELSYVET